MEIVELIKAAKIGRERKEAQNETCATFAAALYDVLEESGYVPSLLVACHRGATLNSTWYHQVVEVDGVMYDSMGEFNTEIIRERLKIHKTVNFEIEYQPDRREDCFDADDYQALYDFLVKELRKSAVKIKTLQENSVAPKLP